MKRLIVIIIALTMAVGIGLSLHKNPGLMIVTFAGWRVDMPLWIGLLLILLLYLTIHYVLLILHAIIHVASFVKQGVKKYRLRRAKRLTQRGFIAFILEDYQKAEKALVKSAQHSGFPWLNTLFAAKAANALQNVQKRDVLLHRANILIPDAKIAVLLTQAQLQYEHGEYAQSIILLKRLHEHLPHHPTVLKLLEASYLATENWEALAPLLPQLKSVLTEGQYHALVCKLWNAMSSSVQNITLAGWQAIWQQMPKDCHYYPDIALDYARVLEAYHHPVEAEGVLHKALKHEWQEKLIQEYGNLIHPTPEKLLNTAEHWLKTHADSPGLLSALGRICVQLKLWGKAQQYFEASLNIAADPKTCAQLAILFEQQQKPEIAAQYFKQGLLLVALVQPRPHSLSPLVVSDEMASG